MAVIPRARVVGRRDRRIPFTRGVIIATPYSFVFVRQEIGGEQIRTALQHSARRGCDLRHRPFMGAVEIKRPLHKGAGIAKVLRHLNGKVDQRTGLMDFDRRTAADLLFKADVDPFPDPGTGGICPGSEHSAVFCGNCGGFQLFGIKLDDYIGPAFIFLPLL